MRVALLFIITAVQVHAGVLDCVYHFLPAVQFHTEHTTVRKVRADDADFLKQVLNHPRVRDIEGSNMDEDDVDALVKKVTNPAAISIRHDFIITDNMTGARM